ncbi:tetrapyrrole methylase [Lipomyces kononenkoae]
MAFFFGLGLSSAEDITLRGLKVVQQCARVYLEAYTSILMTASKEDLENLYGREVILADREMVESSSDSILQDADKVDVAFLVVGDPFGATTHTDLIIRARSLGIPFEAIHNASVMNAVGACGLQLYNFGQTVSLVFFMDNWKPDSFYDRIKENREIGLHTLLLLDIKVKEQSFENMARGRMIYEPPRYMNIETAASQLLEIEDLRNERAFTADTPCVSVSRLGSPDQKFVAATLGELANIESGEPLHSLVILGHRTHEMEIEYLLDFATDKKRFQMAVEKEVEAARELQPAAPAGEDND